MKRNSGNILLVILIVVGVVAVSVGGYFYLWPRFRYPAQNIQCVDDNQCPPEYYCYKNPENKDMFYLGGPGKCVYGQRQLQVTTPSDDPTVNWKIYINNLYSLSYPSKYKLSEDKENNRITLDFPGPPPPPDIVIDIKATPSKTGETTQTFVAEEKTGRLANANIPYRVTGESEISIGGEKWTVLSWSQPDTKSFYIVHGNYRFVINKFSVTDGGAQKTVKEFAQILSTFKFTDQNNVSGTICGGWDPSGQIICGCSSGQMTKALCPVGTVCDSGTYYCQGQCGTCCYKGIGVNPKYSPCD